MSDLEVIKILEQQVGEELKLVAVDTVMKGNSRCSFARSPTQQIIGLNLQNCQQTDIGSLKLLKHLTHLNLSCNQISNLAPLKQLSNLLQLNLQKNNISEIGALKELKNLTELNLQDNQIIELKPLKYLHNLIHLNLQANQITDLKSLQDLNNVTELSLGANPLNKFDTLKYLPTLTKLDLINNQIADLEFLQHLKKLVELDLRFNEVADITSLKELTALKKIYLNNNRIVHIDAVSQLTELTHLYLASNEITNIHPLAQLVGLIELDLRFNKISDLTPLKQLIHLQHLYLEHNEISDLTALKNLSELIELNLRANSISKLDALKGFKKLVRLFLSNNQIKFLPEWILDFQLKIKWNVGGDGISVSSNPLKYPPPEIIRQGNSAIRDYFSTLESRQRHLLNEVKILVVGDSGVGKTSLMKRLCNENIDFSKAEPTLGIQIKSWQYKNIIAHIWDFGGDEILQATHQLFFSARSLYILVIDEAHTANIERWLQCILNFGADSAVLIVQNKYESNCQYQIKRDFLLSRYHNLQKQNFFTLSCKEKNGLDEFKQALIAQFKQLPIIRTSLLGSWLKLKNSLEQQQKESYFLSQQFYLKACQEHGLKEKNDQELMLQLLIDLGLSVCFTNYTNLENYLLEPDWIIKSLYKIISSTQVRDNKGILYFKDLAHILAAKTADDYQYRTENYHYLIKLLLKCELCYLIDIDAVLIPQLLDNQEPEFEFNHKEALRFHLHYNYLDAALIPRLMVALHKDLVKNQYWRTGMLLKNNAFNSTALIKADYEYNLLNISVMGEQKHNYFSTIRRTLRKIDS